MGLFGSDPYLVPNKETIKMFFARYNIKPNGYIKNHCTRISYYKGSKLINAYLEIKAFKHRGKNFDHEKFNKLTKLYVKHSSNKLKDLFEDLLA